MFRTPGGRPASVKISPQISPPTTGESSDGFRTTVLPSASGAAIERAERISAAFHGAIAPTTPTGPPQPHRERARVGRDHLAERGVGERRRLAEQAGHEDVRLEHRESERAAGLAREQRDDLVLPRFEDVGGLEEDPLAHRRRRLRPLRERGLGGRDRARRVLAPARGDVGDGLAGERIAGLERAPAGGIDPLAADELTALRGAGLRLLLLQIHRVLLRRRVSNRPYQAVRDGKTSSRLSVHVIATPAAPPRGAPERTRRPAGWHSERVRAGSSGPRPRSRCR